MRKRQIVPAAVIIRRGVLATVIGIPVALGGSAWIQLLHNTEGPDGAAFHTTVDVDANSVTHGLGRTSSLTLRLSIDQDAGLPQLRHIVSIEHVIIDCDARTYRVTDGITAYRDGDEWVPGPSPASTETIRADNPRATALIDAVCAYLK